MSSQTRVEHARERLETAADEASNDSVLRIVKLNPPAEAGQSLLLNRRLTVFRGMSASGLRTLFATLDGMQRDAARATGVDNSVALEPDTSSLPTHLEEIFDSCEQALLLSGAEVRGANMVLADIDDKIRFVQNVAKPGQSAEPAFVEFITQVLDSPADARSIEDGLAVLQADPRRVALAAACALDVENPGGRVEAEGSGPRLFGSTARHKTNLVRAEAEGELSEYDMAPGSPAYVLASRLDYVGIPTSPLDAARVATRLLAEIDLAMDEKNDFEASINLLTGSAADLAEQRHQVLWRRENTERRVSTQRHLRRIAQLQMQDHVADRPRGLMPVLIEEPFVDLPSHLTGPMLAMLLRHSELAQVILVTERDDVRQWCSTAGEHAMCVEATGWFAEEHAGW